MKHFGDITKLSGYDRWCVSWRIHDAQLWGIPQRRRRIALVADFGGMCSAEVLFERAGLHRNTPQIGEEKEEGPGRNDRGTTRAISFQERAGCPGGGKGILIQDERVGALSTLNNQSVFMFSTKRLHPEDRTDFDAGTSPTLTADTENCIVEGGIVRHLTPKEMERLQGYPDDWTLLPEWTDSKGKCHQLKDSDRYKALGNSIALPFWFWLLRRISAQYERPATLGSLFDGIGGFPLCWERCNGKGTAIWASEIEEFPIAVTKRHFPEEE